MSDFPSQESLIRRTDVILRGTYPHLQTRIFEISPHKYQIFVDDDSETFSSLRDDFTMNIAQASYDVKLVNQIPSSFRKEIPCIDDRHLIHKFTGFPFSGSDIRRILLSKFPDLPNLKHMPNQNNPICLAFETPLSADQQIRVSAFMDGLLPNWPVTIRTATEDELSHRSENGSVRNTIDIDVRPARLRPKAPSFVRGDESAWYDNIDNIFLGKFCHDAVRKVQKRGCSCYIDASSFPQIDLRQALLFYDNLYLSPPLVDMSSIENFWDHQTLSQSDILKLVETERLHFVLTQPEERNDIKLLEAAYERRPSSIIGRLAGSAILANDIASTAEDYIFSDPRFLSEISNAIPQISQTVGANQRQVSQLLLWPLYARRICFYPLMSRGLLGLSSFNQGIILAEELKAITGRDLRLEATLTSNAVHVAHALNATLIPPAQEMGGWLLPRRVVAERLNFYRSFTSRIAASWAVNEKRKEQRRYLVPPLPLFEFDRRASLDDLLESTSQFSTMRKGRGLLARLTDMPIEERSAEINRLSHEVYAAGGRWERRNLLVDSISDLTDVGTWVASIAAPPLKPALNLFTKVITCARKIHVVDSFIDDLQQDLPWHKSDKEEIDFLSKIQRVAEIKDIRH